MVSFQNVWCDNSTLTHEALFLIPFLFNCPRCIVVLQEKSRWAEENACNPPRNVYNRWAGHPALFIRACSSAGRAFGSHPRGRGFESLQVHHKGTVAMIQIATVLFNFSLLKSLDIKPKAKLVGSNANLPTSLFLFSGFPGNFWIMYNNLRKLKRA